MTTEETTMGNEIEVRRDTTLVLPGTGEAFDLAEPDQAAKAVRAFRQAEEYLTDLRREAEQALVDESIRQGRKTLRFESTGDDRLTVEISGGPGATSIDVDRLREGLTAAGCPEDRINAAIKATYEYKADRSVCRQLAAANPEYKKAVDAATYTFEKRYQVKVG